MEREKDNFSRCNGTDYYGFDFTFNAVILLLSLQIVNWRTHLKFPEEAKLSPEAKDVVSKLLCNVNQRLGSGGADKIKVLYCSIILRIFSHIKLIVHNCNHLDVISSSGSSLV